MNGWLDDGGWMGKLFVFWCVKKVSKSVKVKKKDSQCGFVCLCADVSMCV